MRSPCEQVVCCRIGRGGREAEKFVSNFEPTFSMQRKRILGDELLIFKTHESKWQVIILYLALDDSCWAMCSRSWKQKARQALSWMIIHTSHIRGPASSETLSSVLVISYLLFSQASMKLASCLENMASQIQNIVQRKLYCWKADQMAWLSLFDQRRPPITLNLLRMVCHRLHSVHSHAC